MRRLVTFGLIALSFALAGCTSRAPSPQPQGADHLLRQSEEQYGKGEYDEAIRSLDEAARLAPENALVFSRRGAVRFAKKEYDQAIADLDVAIRLAPGQSEAGYYIRGAAWYMKKEYAKGVRDLDEAIRLNPKDAEALNSRAWAAATCPDTTYRDRTKALDYAKRACELNGWGNPYYLGTLAAAYASNGEFTEAVKWQRRAMENKTYLETSGAEGRRTLELFEQDQPYREKADGGK